MIQMTCKKRTLLKRQRPIAIEDTLDNNWFYLPGLCEMGTSSRFKIVLFFE